MTNKTIKAFAVFTTILMTAACAFAAATGDNADVYSTYGCDMTEDYYVARKIAIRDGKLLFVLSGSASCNYCNMTKNYLYNHSDVVDPKFVCYYAKLQNKGGKSEFQGGLPQYGTYDPRTIDAYTGCYDAAGNYQPSLAWYSGHDGQFDSSRGYAADVIQRCIDTALRARPTLGKFKEFVLEGPDTIVEGMSASYALYAKFDDDVTMLVDHGVKWVVPGSSQATDDGVITAGSGISELTITSKNTFYDFGEQGKEFTKTVAVVKASAIKSIEIDETPFNLEDNPTVILKAWANLEGGRKAAVLPTWKIEKNVESLPLPQGAPIWARDTASVSVKSSGEVVYGGDDGINVQDHYLTVTATVNGKEMTKKILVYGPSRLWASKWEITSGDTAASGSVVKIKVNELKFTYKGAVITTNDTRYADFYTSAIKDMVTQGAPGLAVNIPHNFSSRPETTMKIYVRGRRKGGKYTGLPDCELNGYTETYKTINFNKTNTTVNDRHGIGVNDGWAKIYFKGQALTQSLLDADSDGDGYTNAEEFLLGTDPTKKDDHWRFTACHFDWPDSIYYRVMFMNSQFPGRTYTIEGKRNYDDSTWSTLGVMKGEEPGVVNSDNVALATECHYFRVSARLEDGVTVAIPGLGVYTGPEGHEVDVVIKPKEGEVYPSFAVDANNLTYPIYVDMTLKEGETTPLFTMTVDEVEEGQLDRIVPTKDLSAQGWYLIYKKDGIWANFYATKTAPTVKAWSEVTDTTAYAKIPGLTATQVTDLQTAAILPTKLAQWAMEKGNAKLGDTINLECFILNAANATETPELMIDADDLAKILAVEGNPTVAAEAIGPKYPNAKVIVKDVTEEICGKTEGGVKLFKLVLSL